MNEWLQLFLSLTESHGKEREEGTAHGQSRNEQSACANFFQLEIALLPGFNLTLASDTIT